MPQSSSAERVTSAAADRLNRWPAFQYHPWVRISLWVSVIAVAALFGWGAWQRRWIADDGLIVLRTVRNLLAGNGPVFNAGERVEANTSTAWSYLVTLGGFVSGSARLEIRRAHAGSRAQCARRGPGHAGHRTALRAPDSAAGARSSCPRVRSCTSLFRRARDFATSWLENGLVLAYLGLLWWMMVCWSQAPATAAHPADSRSRSRSSRGSRCCASRVGTDRRRRTGDDAHRHRRLDRPADPRRRRRPDSGGLSDLPDGYYGLLVPGTALAKDASGAKWDQVSCTSRTSTGPTCCGRRRFC